MFSFLDMIDLAAGSMYEVKMATITSNGKVGGFTSWERVRTAEGKLSFQTGWKVIGESQSPQALISANKHYLVYAQYKLQVKIVRLYTRRDHKTVCAYVSPVDENVTMFTTIVN